MLKKENMEQFDLFHLAPKRVKVLTEAARLTSVERTAIYGAPDINMDCLAAYMRVFLHYSGVVGREAFANGHDAAMFNVLSKVARITVGSKGHMDNYVDGAAYFAMAFEVDSKTE